MRPSSQDGKILGPVGSRRETVAGDGQSRVAASAFFDGGLGPRAAASEVLLVVRYGVCGKAASAKGRPTQGSLVVVEVQ